MTRKQMIVKAMKRDAEIHARGYFNADERDTNTIIILTDARWTKAESEEDDSVASRMKEFVEAY
jgi:hypothetical protein